MTHEEFLELLQLTHEVSGVEFKPPGNLKSDKVLRFTVARAVMGMANRRDGGRVVLGVREVAGKLELIGLTASELNSWRYDLVADALAPLSDPPAVFETEVHEHEGRQYVVLLVNEFEDVPIICRRNSPRVFSKNEPPILQEGMVYVRTRRKPETTAIPSQTEMRELVELATEKRLRQVMGTVSRAGAFLRSSAPAEEAFDAELGDEFQ